MDNVVVRHSSGDLCTAYRPISFSGVIGQNGVVASIRTAVTNKNSSKCYLFHGERGCGKTTVARLFAMAVNCENIGDDGEPCGACPSCLSILEGSSGAIKEINAANHNSVNDIRMLEEDMSTRSIFSNNKVYILDEVHMLSKEAQNALLKNVENIPDGFYVVMCSTEPKKLIKTLRDRCEQHRFDLVGDGAITDLVKNVAVLEDSYLDDVVLSSIVSSSEGRPRNALMSLQKIINAAKAGLPTEDLLVMADVHYDEEDISVIELCKLLTLPYASKWSDIMSKYKAIKATPETTSIVLAGWMRSFLEKAKSKQQADKYAAMLELFVDIPMDIKPENRLVLNLYKAFRISNGQ